MNAPYHLDEFQIPDPLPAPRKGPFERLGGFIHHMLFGIALWRIMLVGVSFYTTARGAILLYGSYAGTADDALGYLSVVIPVAFAGMLHALIFDALERFAVSRRRRHLAAGVLLQVAAILLSFGTHWTHMQGPATVLVEQAAAQQRLVRGLRITAASYASVAAEMTALSEHSGRQAMAEEARGGTCDRSGAGPGPRRDLRNDDRDLFAEETRRAEAQSRAFNRLAERAAELTATDAAHALANARKLAAIVDEARALEQQPFLSGLRQTVDARRQKGQGAIPMPERWRKAGGATSFTCPDAVLDQRLAAVANAVAGVRPVPEVDVPDYRDPQVGVPKALQRVLSAIAHLRLLPPSRPEQETDRAKVLNASVEAGGLQKGDLLPLAMAAGIEALLTLTYLFAGASFAQEGAIEQVGRRLRNDGRRGVFQRLWQAMGDDAAVFRAFNRHVFWRHGGAYVFVPASDEADAIKLRTIMEVAADAGLARRKATGRRLARLYAIGWDRERREAVFGQGVQVRVYGLRHRDVVAILVDASGAEPEAREAEAEPGPVSWL